MIRLSFLLIAVPLILGIIYLVKRTLQRSATDAMLEKIDNESYQYAIVKDLDVTQIKKQREDLARIKKEIQ